MGNIFPARKTLVSEIPAGSRERDWDIFYSVAFNNRLFFAQFLSYRNFAALKYFSLSRIWTIQAMMHVIFRRPRKAETALLFFLHSQKIFYKSASILLYAWKVPRSRYYCKYFTYVASIKSICAYL